MKPSLAVFVCISVLILVLSAINAEACSCLRRETCEYASASNVTFVGKVLVSSEVVRKVKSREMPIGGEWEDIVREERHQVSRLSVTESFLGVDEGTEVLIETDIFSSCAFPLTQGETYIVYANRNDSTGDLMTGMCSGTKPVSAAQTELDLLRAERGKFTTVNGKVGFGDFGKLETAPLKKFGVNTVKLIGKGDEQRASIDSDGTFRFRNVRAGEYRVEVVVPDILLVKEGYNEEVAEELEIKDQRLFSVSGIGCVMKEFPVTENGRIGGRLLDVRGQPIKDVTVYAIPIDHHGQPIKQDEDCYDTDLCVSAKEDGRYFFKGLKSGSYLIGIRLDDWVCNDCIDAAYKRTVYPGVGSGAGAKPIVVSFGNVVNNIDLTLTKKYTEREIKGGVVFANGRPAANVQVRFVARTPDRKNNGISFIKTDSEGNFSITGYDEHSYLIGAFTNEHDGNAVVEAKAEVVNVISNKPIAPVHLVLDHSSTDDDFSNFPKAIDRRH